jgi:hypothetical protein
MTLQAHAEPLYAGIRSFLGKHDAKQVQAKLERELRHIGNTWRNSHSPLSNLIKVHIFIDNPHHLTQGLQVR